MDFKLNLITPCVYSKPDNNNCLDPLAEEFAEYVKVRADQVGLPCKYNKVAGLAFIHRFEDFEERFLIHSEYAVIIGTPNSLKSLNQFLPRLLVFLSIKSIWQNRFLIVSLGDVDVLDNLVVHAPIRFSLNNWRTGDDESWAKLFGLVKVKWIPYEDPNSKNKAISDKDKANREFKKQGDTTRGSFKLTINNSNINDNNSKQNDSNNTGKPKISFMDPIKQQQKANIQELGMEGKQETISDDKTSEKINRGDIGMDSESLNSKEKKSKIVKDTDQSYPELNQMLMTDMIANQISNEINKSIKELEEISEISSQATRKSGLSIKNADNLSNNTNEPFVKTNETSEEIKQSSKNDYQASKDNNKLADDKKLFKNINQSSKDTDQPIKMDSQSYKNSNQIIKSDSQSSKDTKKSSKMDSQSSKDTDQPIKMDGQSYKDSNQIIKSDSQSSKDTNQPIKMDSQSFKDTVQPIKMDNQSNKDSSQIIKNDSQSSKDTNQPIKMNSQSFKDTAQPIKMDSQSSKDTNQLIKMDSQSFKDTAQPIKMNSQSSKDTNQPIKLDSQTSKDANEPIKIDSQLSKNTNEPIKIDSQSFKDSYQPIRIDSQLYKDTGFLPKNDSKPPLNTKKYKEANPPSKKTERLMEGLNFNSNITIKNAVPTKQFSETLREFNEPYSLSTQEYCDSFRGNTLKYGDDEYMDKSDAANAHNNMIDIMDNLIEDHIDIDQNDPFDLSEFDYFNYGCDSSSRDDSVTPVNKDSEIDTVLGDEIVTPKKPPKSPGSYNKLMSDQFPGKKDKESNDFRANQSLDTKLTPLNSSKSFSENQQVFDESVNSANCSETDFLIEAINTSRLPPSYWTQFLNKLKQFVSTVLGGNNPSRNAIQPSGDNHQTAQTVTKKNKFVCFMHHPLGGFLIILTGTLLTPYCYTFIRKVPRLFQWTTLNPIMVFLSRSVVHEDQMYSRFDIP